MTDTAVDDARTPALDHLKALDDLLAPIGLSHRDAGGDVIFTGRDPIVPDNVPLAAAIGIPMMANAVAAAAFHRARNGEGAEQDLGIDLRQAVHHVTPHAFFHPTLAGELPCHALTFDNPFLLDPFVTKDGRVVMASGVYPHLAAKWCRFLDVPPDTETVAAAFATWNAFELEEAANEAGLPLCVARTPEEWLAHPQGKYLATTPVVTLERTGDAPVRNFGSSQRPFEGIRVLSFTHAIAGPTVGRTFSEHGADVLCATRNNDYEHDFIYVQANIGSRSTYVDLTTESGRSGQIGCCGMPTSWSTTTVATSSSGSASITRSLPRATQASSRYRSPATARTAPGRTAAGSI